MSQVKLSLECSTPQASFLLSDIQSKKICELVIEKSDVLIFKDLPKILNEYGIKTSDITTIAWSRGPGSFTGIRLCATWVQSLSYINHINVISICSMQARVLKYCQEHVIKNGEIFGYLKANRQYVYFGIWKIIDGIIHNKSELSVKNNDFLMDTYVDLGFYEPSANEIHFLSDNKSIDYESSIDPFSIRPNYLFDHFS